MKNMTKSVARGDEEWKKDTNYALGLYRIILKVLGIWPYNSQEILSILILIFHYFLQVTMVIEILGEVHALHKGIDTEKISYLSCNFLVLVKLSTIRTKQTKLKKVLQSVIKSWNEDINSDIIKTMLPKVKLGRNICIYQLGSTYFVILPAIIGALPIFQPGSNQTLDTNNSDLIAKSMPIPSPHTLGNISGPFYTFVYIIQIFQLFSTCTGNVGVDCSFFGITMNLCGQIKCLQQNFEKLSAMNDELEIQKNFSMLVKKHNEFIELARHLEEIFNLIIFCIVGGNVTQVCLYGIHILRSLRHGDTVTAVNSGICIIILNFQIFLYSWAGDHLSSSLESFKANSYNCEWNNMPINFRKNLIFMMMRTNKVFNLTAGKIYRMDLDSFKNIMKAIGSYFSVMQAMFED